MDKLPKEILQRIMFYIPIGQLFELCEEDSNIRLFQDECNDYHFWIQRSKHILGKNNTKNYDQLNPIEDPSGYYKLLYLDALINPPRFGKNKLKNQNYILYKKT